jgi:Reductase C-terminal
MNFGCCDWRTTAPADSESTEPFSCVCHGRACPNHPRRRVNATGWLGESGQRTRIHGSNRPKIRWKRPLGLDRVRRPPGKLPWMASPMGQITVVPVGGRIAPQQHDEGGRWRSRQHGRAGRKRAEQAMGGVVRPPGRRSRIDPGGAGVRKTVLADQPSRSLCEPFCLKDAGQQRRDDQRIGNDAAYSAAPQGTAPQKSIACGIALHAFRPIVDAIARWILVKRNQGRPRRLHLLCGGPATCRRTQDITTSCRSRRWLDRTRGSRVGRRAYALGVNAQREIAIVRRLIDRRIAVDPVALADEAADLVECQSRQARPKSRKYTLLGLKTSQSAIPLSPAAPPDGGCSPSRRSGRPQTTRPEPGSTV